MSKSTKKSKDLTAFSNCFQDLVQEYIDNDAFRQYMHTNWEAAVGDWEAEQGCTLTPEERASVKSGFERYKQLDASEVAAMLEGKKATKGPTLQPLGFVFW